MTCVHKPDEVAREGHDGREVGVEIEFAGIGEAETAEIIRARYGGQVSVAGPFRHRITGTRLGDFRVELDTAWRDRIHQGPDLVDRLAHQVIPVEIVTDPIPEADLPELNALVTDLRAAGAQGARANPVNGFGVHFNPAVDDTSIASILPVLQSYALIEPWLRDQERLGLARRVLPFTAPWPEPLRAALLRCDPDTDDIAKVIDLYLDLAPSRNFGLDLLPLWRHIDEDRVLAVLGDTAPGARPTYHFRLPTCRIDEPGWTLGATWQKWLIVERTASDRDLLQQLIAEWQTKVEGRYLMESVWINRVHTHLQASGIAGGHA